MAMPRQRMAFTLVEALVAISLAALAGSVLLLGTTTTVQATHDSQDKTIALGMAQQLMDEVMGTRYLPDSGDPYATTIQPSSSEVSGASRQKFDDIGDFNGYRCQPPKDSWGIELGQGDGAGGLRQSSLRATSGMFSAWRQEIDVCYVSESDFTVALKSPQTSDYRAVETRIVYVNSNGSTRELAKVRRIIAYVSALP